MSRTLNNTILTAAALTLVALTAAETEACGRGGGGRSSSRLSISYNRNIGHMRSQGYGYHRTQPRYVQQPVYVQPQQLPVQQVPVQQPTIQQQLPQQQVAQQPATQQPAATAEQSALAALGGETSPAAAANPIPQFAPAGGSTPAHVGQWSATLPGNNRVQLSLNADGTFRWIANSKGKVSSFEGSFTLADGRLTLLRSGDQQQLSGTWNAEQNGGFRFRVGGQNDGGLIFIRG